MVKGNVIVTGANGWVGRELVSILSGQKDDVFETSLVSNVQLRCFDISFDNSHQKNLDNSIQLIEGSVTSPSDCERLFYDFPDAIVFHLVGIIHPKRVSDFYNVNVEGTKNIVRASEAAGAKRVVVMSSNSPLGTNPFRGHKFVEQDPYNPYMNYGKSKMLMEQFCLEFAAKTNMNISIARAPWFYGPNQPPRQKEFFEMIRAGRGPIVGDGENLRSMVYITNLVQGLILMALHAKSGEVFWIADREPYTMNQIINTIERLLHEEFQQDCAFKRLRLPGLASEVALFCDKLIQSFGLYHQKVHVLSEMNKEIACSVEKAINELNYSPKISLEKGMRNSLAELY